MWEWLGRTTRAVDRAGGGLWADLGLYGLGAGFAAATVWASSLAPHRAWGGIAAIAYASAAVIAGGQLAARRWSRTAPPGASAPSDGVTSPGARAAVTIAAWIGAALVPLAVQAMQRAAGRSDRAQEEVLVVEDGGRRLLEAGTPYLDRDAIGALPGTEQLQAYLPYQPGMAAFGVPRAFDPGAAWWSDARVWFALVAAIALAGALLVLRKAGTPAPALVRALQVATVLPVCALTLATGGDDMPVLALCLLALALAATNRLGLAGLAVGAAAALKLIALPVAVVLGAYAITRGRRSAIRYAGGAVGLPLATALPAVLIDPAAVIENVGAYPLGRGLVSSPAASPLPGYLVAHQVPGGRGIAVASLGLVAVAIGVVLVRRPPRTAAAAAALSGWGLLAAILLLPATRFGYLLYPAGFLVFAAALRPAGTGVPPASAAADRARPVEARPASGIDQRG